MAARNEPLQKVRVIFPSGNTGTASVEQARRCHYRIIDEAPEGPQGIEPVKEPTAAEIRAWAKENDVECSAKGRIPPVVRDAYNDAH